MASNLDDELALRLQAEHKVLMQLNQVLREHIASLPNVDPGPWLDGLRIAFGRLHAHVERSFVAKETDGYLDAVVRERPMLARQVGAIAAETGQLLRLSNMLRGELAAVRPEDGLLIEDACAHVERFMMIVAQHEQRENMIAMFAFNQDFGGD